MGCECSKEKEQQYSQLIVNNSRERDQASNNDRLTFKEITIVLTAIKKNDVFLSTRLLKKKKLQDNLVFTGSRATFLHYAAKYNSYKAMNVFLVWIKEKTSLNYADAVNVRDAHGRTPAMICVMYDSAETLFTLLNTGAVVRDLRDNNDETVLDLARRHSKACYLMLERTRLSQKHLTWRHALTMIRKVRGMTDIVKSYLFVNKAVKQWRSLLDSKKNMTTEARETEVQPDQVQKKARRDFSKKVMWCKARRFPFFDIRYTLDLLTSAGSGIEFFDKNPVTVNPINKKPGKSHTTLLARGKSDDSFYFEVDEIMMFQGKSRLRTIGENAIDISSEESMDEEDSEGYSEDEEDDTNFDEFQKSLDAYDSDEEIEEDVYLMRSHHLVAMGSLKKEFGGMASTAKAFLNLQGQMAIDQNFRDRDFMPSPEAIGKKWLSHNKNIDIVWQRPHEFMSTDYSNIYLFDTIDPHDIKQGMLGVCYLLAAVSALAEFPDRVRKIFVNQESNKYGIYGLNFVIQGIPTEVVVDDYIPCSKLNFVKKTSPIFSRPKGNELWVLLMEKAWAKLFGNYSVVETGISDEAFEYILGVPSYLYLARYQSVNKIWRKIYLADKSNYIISASTNQTANEDVGLTGSHTYSVISAHDISGYKILKLRNPWGQFEWNGDFSDHSSLWTPEIKEEVGYVKAEDGMFCMTVEDFKKHFMGYVIAEYHDDWQYSYIKGTNEPNHAEYFKFTTKYPTEAYLRIHQRNERFKDTPGHSPVDFRVARIAKNGRLVPLLHKSAEIDDTAIFGHHSISLLRRHKLYLEKPGTYIVRVKMLWLDGKKRDYTLSAYSQHKIDFIRVQPVKDFLTQTLLNLGQRAKHKEELIKGCSIARGFSGYNHYIYAENNNTEPCTINMTFPNLLNARLGKHYKTGEDTVEMVLNPGERKVTYLKIVDLRTTETYINPSITCKLTP